MSHLRHWFRFAPDNVGEYAIEVDPRTVSIERVHSLRQQGFNRISLGVQDFDPDVQKAVNRVQPESDTRGADVSFAMAGGARLAQLHADCVLLGEGLAPLADAASTARMTVRMVRQNLGWATVYNLGAMPAAACGLLDPWLSGIGMAASSDQRGAERAKAREGSLTCKRCICSSRLEFAWSRSRSGSSSGRPPVASSMTWGPSLRILRDDDSVGASDRNP